MLERNEFGIGPSSQSPSGRSREFGPVAARHANAGPSSWSRTHRAGRWIALVIIAAAMLAAPASSLATPAPTPARISVGISVSFGPPALPYYSQPPCPAPGYWAYSDGMYLWYDGYWGPVVGYYGGIFYGFGYTGYGYGGGYWRGDQFYYNRSVTNIRTTNITNVYEKTVINNTNVTRVSYNGGPSGTSARPTAEQTAAESQRRSGPVAEQTQHIQTAQSDRRLRASENKGRPEVAATPKPGKFSGGEVVRASRAGAPYRPPEIKAAGPNRSAPRSMPGGNASPGARQTPDVKGPQRAEPSGRVEHQAPAEERQAPAQVEPPREKHQRGGPPPDQPRPNATRVPTERQQPAPRMERQPAPRAEKGRPYKQPRPSEKRGGGNEHKPDKPHN